MDVPLEFLERLGLEAEPHHVEHQVTFVQQPENDLFSEQRRQHRNTEIEFLHLVFEASANADTAVLWDALLRYVQPRHDLDTRRHGILQFDRRAHDGLEHTVNAKANA